MLKPRSRRISLALATIAVVAAALAGFGIHSKPALAQAGVDCQILTAGVADYKTLARGVSELNAAGYAPSGFTSASGGLWALVCRRP